METKTTLSISALMFLTEHQAAHLTRDMQLLMKRCVTYLIEGGQVSEQMAEDAIFEAFSVLLSAPALAHQIVNRVHSYESVVAEGISD